MPRRWLVEVSSFAAGSEGGQALAAGAGVGGGQSPGLRRVPSSSCPTMSRLGRDGSSKLARNMTEVVGQRERAQRLAVRAAPERAPPGALYKNRFQTEEQRITRVIAEVKSLAQACRSRPAEHQLPGRGDRELRVAQAFDRLRGRRTYSALRRFINFLELTDSFVILEELRPSENYDAHQ